MTMLDTLNEIKVERFIIQAVGLHLLLLTELAIQDPILINMSITVKKYCQQWRDKIVYCICCIKSKL